eukprot:scaffold174357_cov28-Tisochrysis_lutea.AAC.2
MHSTASRWPVSTFRQSPERPSHNRISRDTVHVKSTGAFFRQMSSTTPAPWVHVWRKLYELRSQMHSFPSIAPVAPSGIQSQKPTASTDPLWAFKAASTFPAERGGASGAAGPA